MNASKLVAGLVVLGIVAGGGYWLGGRTHASGGGAGPAATPQVAGAPASAPKERKVLYYRNPMGLPDTSPTPKKDPMGMDYIPVYEGEDQDAGAAGGNQIRISTEKIQKIGVRVEAAGMRALGKTVGAAGRVEPDERHVYAIAPKFEGYVERLHVNVTGQPVGKGQPLFEVYSPELVSAQREYIIARQGMQ
ncbi:MAG: efflux RND transporter periplasmic adaptor subunit, partial [Ramlibacter sp.]